MTEFIQRSSSLPAQTLGLKKRGMIKVGHYADILRFDPDQFGPRATFSDATAFSKGVVHLLVNGNLVISGGLITGATEGKALGLGAN